MHETETNPDALFTTAIGSDSVANTESNKNAVQEVRAEQINSEVELPQTIVAPEEMALSNEAPSVQITDYVSLHNHTSFSILDSIIKPIDLFKRSKELGQTAVAVSDHGTLSGLWDSLKASRETGVKLIPGCEFYFIDDVNNKEQHIRHIILLSKNEVGYRNLLLVLAEGFNNSTILFKKVFPLIDWNILEKYSEGIICTTACGNGVLSHLINKKLCNFF